MKFTFNWLNEFVDFEAAPEKLAELLTMAGLEVESLTTLHEPETNREDWLFEVGVTPNRGDCLGIAGIAREVSALTGKPIQGSSSVLSSQKEGIAGRTAVQRGTKKLNVEIVDSHLCLRYSAAIVEAVRMEPSPAWMSFRLESCGVRAINNVVDITNYVMLETGQPLHAFDLDRLPSRRIVVRPAGEITKFTTLDGVERELVPEDLLICDSDLPIALAGVMGGANSEVSSTSGAILLESANFDSAAIRRTAKRLGLHSEASHRFERGVDPEGTLPALSRAVDLLTTWAAARPVPGMADRYPHPAKNLPIVLREARVAEILGVRITGEEIQTFLSALGLKTRRQKSGGKIKVVVPTSRADLTREADLIEELARLHG
ncbi:MAG: phenylalanine--tRNA ligase subunit beta, partial [Candidatus Binatia bacterium]